MDDISEAQSDGAPAPTSWNFRGYRLSTGEFSTAMVHLYRGEVTRSNTWRSRLDTTTNWAVISTGAALSFVFSSATNSHVMIPINTMLITLFLYIEARRYRYYELWSHRVRLMETEFFAAMLAPPFSPDERWASRLVSTLRNPTFPITFTEAFGRRFRRNYIFIYLLLGVAWIVKILIHPEVATSTEAFLAQAALGPIPGTATLAAGILFNLVIFAFGLLSAGLRDSQGEVLYSPGEHSPVTLLQSAGQALSERGLWPRQQELLAYVITDHGQEIGERILTNMARGVTELEGRGMYSGQPRAILLVAIHPDQAVALKKLVREIDPKAFVIIHHADEIIGSGFRAPS